MSGYKLEAGLNWTTTFFNQQNKKPIFSITPDGRFIPKEGLSDDEVTQHFAEAMAGTFQSQIRYSVSKDMADEIKRLREALWLIENDANSLHDAVKIVRAALEGKDAND